ELGAVARVSRSWTRGRQGTGYDKLALEADALGPHGSDLLARSLHLLRDPAPSLWDCWLLRYEVGAYVPPHVDPPLDEGRQHVRLNLLVARAARGGELRLDGLEVSLEQGDAVVFRPDLCTHEVSRVDAGARLVWSVGCNLDAPP